MSDYSLTLWPVSVHPSHHQFGGQKFVPLGESQTRPRGQAARSMSLEHILWQERRTVQQSFRNQVSKMFQGPSKCRKCGGMKLITYKGCVCCCDGCFALDCDFPDIFWLFMLLQHMTENSEQLYWYHHFFLCREGDSIELKPVLQATVTCMHILYWCSIISRQSWLKLTGNWSYRQVY